MLVGPTKHLIPASAGMTPGMGVNQACRPTSSDQNLSPQRPGNTGLSRLISPTYPRAPGPCYCPLSCIARTEVDANDAVQHAGGSGSCPAWACEGEGPVPPVRPLEDLKPRAPRRLRLILIHIEAYAPRGFVHSLSQTIARADPEANIADGRARTSVQMTLNHHPGRTR